MLSFFNLPASQKKITNDQLIDILETGSVGNEKLIPTFGRLHGDRHGNTLLLQALAWNKLHAAETLLALDKDKIALQVPDTWPTCLNTPLLLAAKIGAIEIVKKLIELGADTNKQDYRGFTALHYACMLRLDEMINLLLDAGAAHHHRDAFGKLPIDYYVMTISEQDLAYRYGKSDGRLNFIADSNNHYFATQKKCLSALRWYIPHLIVNKNLGEFILLDHGSLRDYAYRNLMIREPVTNATVYEAMMRSFCENRLSCNPDVSAKLVSSVELQTAYTEEKFDRYQLSIADLLPLSRAQQENKNVTIELQELPRSAMR